MKIDNMREEHHEKVIRDSEKQADEVQAERKEDGFIVVSAGEGMSEIFKDFNVDYIIEGGQTMNPSTEDMLEAIDKVNAENIYILPNNGNIILAAEQAKTLTEDKNIVIIPTKNIPQGIAALINYIPGNSVEDNTENMTSEMLNIKSGQVTYAVRDTNMDGKDIKQGDFMGLTDKTIVSVAGTVNDAALELIDSMIDEDSELVSLYYGEELSEEEAEKLADDIMEKHEDVEVEIQYGGQPVYSYFISVE